MNNAQAGILHSVPRHSRYLSFYLEADNLDTKKLLSTLQKLTQIVDGDNIVLGIGPSLLQALGVTIEGMRLFPVMSGPGFDIPSTPAALWCWLRGDDRGELYHQSRIIEQTLFPDFNLGYVLDGFMYADSRDLSGYEDGTENPTGEEAISAAIVSAQGVGLDGASFVAVQQWVHDLGVFEEKSQKEQDDIIGRRRSDNEEFSDAPESAHVKRSAQENFDPEAFMLRRSMPWTEGTDAGLNFVAFGKSFDAFEAILSRMIGADDGISDALFSFTRPVTGAYFWCPPMKDNRLDLSLLSL
ncbi:MAG: Dyp-type peroxidase [Gammaproteobacteria bacterium]|nr:Dyp-type peroxidase [Gammaproteobacteria bacterium]